jgi:hypothetical protein
MIRKTSTLAVVTALLALSHGANMAVTRDLAEFRPTRLAFDRSIINQLSYDTYRDPFDELQTRPQNLLFNNIGRHPNLSPWQGQEGSYTRYFNALIGNNGKANVDNDSDAIQGALIRRETGRLAWGVSAAFLSGTTGSDDVAGTSTFADSDDLTGLEARGAAAYQLSDNRVLGAGVRLSTVNSEVSSSSFEQAVGGFNGNEVFDEFGVTFDVSMRQFRSADSSWEIQAAVGIGNAEQDDYTEDLDDTGAITDRFVITNYDISDLTIGVSAGYNKQKPGKLGETEYRLGVEQAQRELDNADLSYAETLGVVTPSLTLVDQDSVDITRIHASAKSIFQAGETEMFTGATLAYSMTEGSTSVDSSGVIINESVDDSGMHLGLTVGLRQPLFGDKLRFIVSGRGDFTDGEQSTVFDTSSVSDDFSQSTSQYAIGLEGVLANVTFDIAWLLGEEAPVVPVDLGLPTGSRRAVVVDRLVFSAALAW